jgi:hypothetical protein
MFARILIVMLIAVLALPVATLTRPAETNPSPWGDVAVDAKGKKHKHHKKHKTRKRSTQRKTVTRTFTSTEPITIPGAPGVTYGNANPYPAAIAVNGFVNGVITDVNLTLHDFSHTAPVDVDILLVPEHLPGQNAIVMSDAGNDPDVTDLTLTLDDQAAALLPVEGPLVSGTFRPTNVAGSSDAYPGQTPNGNSPLIQFIDGNPNGSWQLFVVDDGAGDTGQIAGGWSLEITAEADVQVKAKQKKHK